jgi:nucleoside permease NupC
MAARNLKSKKMTETEMAEAQERQETFNQAKEYASDADKHAIDLAALINNYLLVKAGIEKIFSVDVLMTLNIICGYVLHKSYWQMSKNIRKR